jgi:ketosteroid isomerase-like protein
MTIAPLTERDAARAWALAYNTHDPSVLASILADDVRVMSRWVVNDLVGRAAYIEYLDRKFTTFESAGSLVRVEVAHTPGDTRGSSGRPCALIEQDGAALATVFFDVVGGKIVQISLGPYPPPESCLRTGEFPGFDDGDDLVN